MTRTTPFIKWVGGKSQLLGSLSKLITHKSVTYYEPFLGGGAVFFHFADQQRFQRAVLNDTNPELVNCYQVVRDRLPELLGRLDLIKTDVAWNTQTYFNRVRSAEYQDPLDRAVRFIYLNRTAFNGLYRVNRSGKFNAPFGKYDNPMLYDAQNILECSKHLKRYATLRTGDFSEAVKDAKAGDLVYFDPPYVPVSKTANFTSYAGQFGPDEQEKLAELFEDLVDRGVFCIQSNSDAPAVRRLYGGFDLNVVGAKRSINSKGDGRGEVNELVIVGKPINMAMFAEMQNFLCSDIPVECAGCGTVYISSDIVCVACGSTDVL